MESFAKLADSIYFKTMPEEPPSAAGAATPGDPARTEGGPPPKLLPQLFVNQLVSSSVRWRELRVVVHQQAGEHALPVPPGLARRSLARRSRRAPARHDDRSARKLL